jgi:hypothetical protein
LVRKSPAKVVKAPLGATYNEWGEAILLESYDLVPDLGRMEEALVYQLGAEKYGANNWRKGMPWHVCLAKLQRHLGAFLAGYSRDPRDGQHHLASVKFWCNALMEYEQMHPELDDITVNAPRE